MTIVAMDEWLRVPTIFVIKINENTLWYVPYNLRLTKGPFTVLTHQFIVEEIS